MRGSASGEWWRNEQGTGDGQRGGLGARDGGAVIEPMAMLQCVQCARTAEAMGAARLLVLWQGVWVLLVPPLAVFGGILWFAWKRSRQTAVGMVAGADMVMGADSRTGDRR